MSVRVIIAALIALLSLPLIGYLWPLPETAAPDTAEDRWLWPEARPRHELTAPANLATFWPGVKPLAPGAQGNDADSAPSAAQQDWMLIGLINQGGSRSALVKDPEGNILVLKPGDALDEVRAVTTLESTRLYWQDDAGNTGDLPLYPEPALE